jgi:hypothetical protein
MKMRAAGANSWILALALATACATASQKSPGEKAIPTPADLADKIQLSIDYGRSIYAQDHASAIGTDVLFANLPRDEKEAWRGGYLTVREAEEGEPPKERPYWTVVFYTKSAEPLIKYRIRVPVDGVTKPSFERVVPPEPPTRPMALLIRAREAAIQAAGPFDQSINPVVLPGMGFGDRDDLLVELLAGTTKPNTIVLGKHFRVLVSSDGARVKSVTPLSKGALEMSTRSELVPKGAQVTGLYVTQIVTDYPVETHVFASMLSRMPLYVLTSRGTWLVDRDSIRLICLPKAPCGQE